jgi:hypothetical protein
LATPQEFSPTATPPKPAEATLGFSSTGKTIDNSPGWRYSSDQKKGALNFLYVLKNSKTIRSMGLSIAVKLPMLGSSKETAWIF